MGFQRNGLVREKIPPTREGRERERETQRHGDGQIETETVTARTTEIERE
jgi:hypothetical protein